MESWCSTTDDFERDRTWGQCATSLGCINSYSIIQDTRLISGDAQPTAQSLSECMEICDTDAFCWGFHYDNGNGIAIRCFTYSNSSSPQLEGAAGVNLYKLTNRCNTGEMRIIPLTFDKILAIHFFVAVIMEEQQRKL